ncbi:hypothetical protein BH23GEM9_BH23GEM9_10670 [soil metagenome]
MTFVALVMAALAVTAQDPVRVEASLSSDRIAVGETTTLTVSVETRGARPDPIRTPPLPPELDVIGTSDFSQTSVAVPGGRFRSTRREFVIAASERGIYRIPAVTVIVDGTTYRTEQLLLTVSGSAYSGPGGSVASAAASSLRVWVNSDTVFVGQQVLLHAEVTFAEDMRTRQSRPPAFDPPAPTGFWVQDLPDPVTISLRVREGRTVESQTFRRAYFPLSPGSFALPPAHLHYEVRRSFLSPPENRRISSDSVRLVVLPLPAEGRPAGFTGAVGHLDVRAAVSPDRIAVGEAAVVTIEFEGRGNVRALPEPAMPRVERAEVFPPTQEARVEVVADQVGGTKRFRWVIIPEAPGTIVIPPVEYGFFDPDLRQYFVLRTDSLRIHAAPVVATPAADTALRPLRNVRGRAPAAWARSPLFAGLQVLPLVLVGAVALVRRRRDRPPGPRQHERRLRAELTALRGRRDVGVPADLERLLHEAVVCLTGASPGDSVSALRAQGREAAAADLAGIIADLRRLRYAPDGQRGNVGPLFERAARFLDSIAPRRGWRSGVAAAVAVLVAAAAVLGAASGRADIAAFDAGVASYQQGDFAAATNQFHAYARAQPDDPNAWYNLGLAAYQAGDGGRGVWAWLRGLRVAPRDPDLRHNLQLIAPPETLGRVMPPDRLATGERLAVAAAAWWLLILAAGLGSRRLRVPRAALGAAAAGAMLVVAVSAAMLSARPTLVTPLRDGAPLFAGPSARDIGAGRLEVGHTARVLDRRDDWLLVRVGRDRDAWVETAAVATP